MKFTEELVGISWVDFKLFISNWKRFDLYFSMLKPKKRARFFFLNESFWMKYQSKGLEVKPWSFQWQLRNWMNDVCFKLIEIWPLFSLLKPKNRDRYLLPFRQILCSYGVPPEKCQYLEIWQHYLKNVFYIKMIRRSVCIFPYKFHLLKTWTHILKRIELLSIYEVLCYVVTIYLKTFFNFKLFFGYLNMYVSTQKLAQIFLDMSATCCESFKSFGEVGKNFFLHGVFFTPVTV